MLILNTISNSKICGDVILLQDLIFSICINIRANLLEAELYSVGLGYQISAYKGQGRVPIFVKVLSISLPRLVYRSTNWQSSLISYIVLIDRQGKSLSVITRQA